MRGDVGDRQSAATGGDVDEKLVKKWVGVVREIRLGVSDERISERYSLGHEVAVAIRAVVQAIDKTEGRAAYTGEGW